MSTTYTLTAGEMATRAYRIIGNLQAPAYTPTADQMNQAIIALNIMLKGMQADGINLYRQTQLQLAIPAGIGYAGNPFEITPLVLGMEEVRLQIQPAPNLYERPLAIYSYIDYMNLPNKLSNNTSGPSVVTLDRQTTQSNLYMWPLATNGCILNGTFGRTVNDVNVSTDAIDAPIEWMEGLTYTLADRLLDDEGTASADPATAQRVAIHAVAFYKKLLDFDRPSSVFVRPWGRKGSGKFWR